MRRDRVPFLDPALLAVAAARHGVFTASEARRLGHTQNDLQAMRRHGDLHSVRRGVYVLGAVWHGATADQQIHIRVSALALALGAPGVLSHATAAHEQRLELLEPDHRLLHVTREGAAGTRVEAGVKHHAAELPDNHVQVRTGTIDLTAPARTATDVARGTDRFEVALAALDSALRAGVPRDVLLAVQLHCRSWPGARILAAAMPRADGRAANPGESWSRAVLLGAGLPPDDLQVELRDADGLIGYADFGWDGVVGEMDGRGKYGIGVADDPTAAAQRVWKEKIREDRIRALGLEVARWTYADHWQPGRITDRVLQAMARASGRRRSA